MTDTVFSAWFESDLEIAYGQQYESQLANNQLEFASGIQVPEATRELRAAGGIYVAKLAISWLGWNQVPIEGYSSAVLKHIADETQNEVSFVHAEVNALHASEGLGDTGFATPAVTKMGLGVVEGPGKFVLWVTNGVDTADLQGISGQLVIAKL